MDRLPDRWKGQKAGGGVAGGVAGWAGGARALAGSRQTNASTKHCLPLVLDKMAFRL